MDVEHNIGKRGSGGGALQSANLDPATATAEDRRDPLRNYRSRFVGADEQIVYLDGNSLGRPLVNSAQRFGDFIDSAWGRRLIRGWDEEWFDLPLHLGDRIGQVVLGAAPGQSVVADSTTVMLYKLIRAAVGARPGRSEIVLDADNFPTDRYVIEGIAADCGLNLRWITPEPHGGVEPEAVATVVGPETALIVLSQVAYRSGFLADVPAITEIAHQAGALVLWDLCHSAGVVPIQLDDWGVDLAVGCTYKYLNGGPGSPAFGYVRAEHQSGLRQPIWGWMGHANPFEMGPGYQPADGMRRFLSGTPAIVGMLAMRDMLDVIEEAGIGGIREKSLQLTSFAIALVDELLVPLGVRLASPRDSERRGSHITIDHDNFQAVTQRLWERDIIPDFRPPTGIRIGLSPLSTSFTEVQRGIEAIHDILCEER